MEGSAYTFMRWIQCLKPYVANILWSIIVNNFLLCPWSCISLHFGAVCSQWLKRDILHSLLDFLLADPSCILLHFCGSTGIVTWLGAYDTVAAMTSIWHCGTNVIMLISVASFLLFFFCSSPPHKLAPGSVSPVSPVAPPCLHCSMIVLYTIYYMFYRHIGTYHSCFKHPTIYFQHKKFHVFLNFYKCSIVFIVL